MDHIFAQNVFETSLGTLPYPLISDWHKKTVKKYHVFKEKDEVAQRSCFLINKKGELVYKNEEFEAGNKEHYDRVYEECNLLG